MPPRAESLALSLLESWNERNLDVFAATSQALGVNLRPAEGSFSERVLVGAQRLRAAWLRRNGD